MITAKEWRAYNDGVAEISDKTEREVVKRLLAWNRLNPNASVAETREYAKLTMDALVQSGGSLASSFAAKWYDYRAEQEHVKLDQAITATVYSPEKTDAVARYQAKKLVAGSFEEFAKACGEYARNDALRALNETIMANAKRDRTKGVRFARVPTGHETCTFCLMLASRGAVYHSRQSAGEFRHFHRHCDCKVVPGFEDDPMAELVEGIKPNEIRERMSEIERLSGLSFGSSKDERNLRKFLGLYDADWVIRGKKVEVGYATETVKAKKSKDPNHDAEKRVAERLAKHGIRTVFVDDEARELDLVTGRYRIIGLPDLDNGIEIKNVSSALSENTISKYITSLKKKRGCVQVVIDVSENTGLSDEAARKMISNSLRRHGLSQALMLNHSEEIERITYPMK